MCVTKTKTATLQVQHLGTLTSDPWAMGKTKSMNMFAMRTLSVKPDTTFREGQLGQYLNASTIMGRTMSLAASIQAQGTLQHRDHLQARRSVCRPSLSQGSARGRYKVLIVDSGTTYTRIGWSHEERLRVVTKTEGLSVPDLIDHNLAKLGEVDFDGTLLCLTEDTRYHVDRSYRQHRDIMARQLMIDMSHAAAHFAGLHIASTAAMQLLAGGQRSGLVVDIGTSVWLTPVYELAVIDAGVRNMSWPTHQDCCRFSLSLLSDLNMDENPEARAEEVRPHCIVAFHYKKEHQATKLLDPAAVALHQVPGVVNVKLNSSKSNANIPIKEQRLVVPELYFKPALQSTYVGGNRYDPKAAPDVPSLPQLVKDAVMSIEPKLRSVMLTNICLAGRGSLFPGFEDRLKMELAELLPEIYDIQVHRCAGQKENLSAYLGAREFARSDCFESSCFWRTEAEERHIELTSDIF